MWNLEASGTLGSVIKQVEEFKPDGEAGTSELLQIEDSRRFISTELSRIADHITAEGEEVNKSDAPDTRLLGVKVDASGYINEAGRGCFVAVKRIAIKK